MALWQADFYLVPHERLAELEPELYGPEWPREEFTWLPELEDRDVEWWATRQPPPGFREALDQLAPRASSWSPKLAVWGREDGDRIDVWQATGGDAVESILVRFDMRNPDEAFIAGVVGLAQDLGCDFLSEDNYLAAGDGPGLAVALRNSRALRFVKDPIAFLRRVAVGGAEDA